MLSPAELKKLHPRKRLSAFVPPPPNELLGEEAGADDDTGEGNRGREAAPEGRGATSGRSQPKALDTIDEGLLRQSTVPPAEFDGTNFGVAKEGGAQGGRGSAGRTKAGRPPPAKPVSATYVWGGLMRLDVVAAPPSTAVAFFGSGSMKVYSMPLLKADQSFLLADGDDAEEEEGESGGSASSPSPSQPPSRTDRNSELVCSASVAARGGLVPHDLRVRPMASGGLGGVGVGGRSGALADVAISG